MRSRERERERERLATPVLPQAATARACGPALSLSPFSPLSRVPCPTFPLLPPATQTPLFALRLPLLFSNPLFLCARSFPYKKIVFLKIKVAQPVVYQVAQPVVYTQPVVQQVVAPAPVVYAAAQPVQQVQQVAYAADEAGR